MAWNPREWWTQRREELEKSQTGGGGGRCERCMQRRGALGFMIPSVKEVAEATIDNILHHERQHGATQDEEDRLARARACTDEGVRAGLKAGLTAGGIVAIPTLVAVRVLPWAKHNLNYTAQALIISAATIGTYFVTCEQTILACSRDASYARIAKEREAKGFNT
ncbi:unnamed protein product [Calypogeia fissa]